MGRINRLKAQISFAILQNPILSNFLLGKIYKGNLKAICTPSLNCYSCPGAIFACPIGALQSINNDKNFNFSFYVLGSLLLFAIFLGRFVCGYMCVFGLTQDLAYKIPTKKIRDKFNVFRYFKYIILLVVVFLLSSLIVDKFGYGLPYFCKYICPSGTFFAGVPLVLGNASLRSGVGLLFYFKLFVAFTIIFLSVIIYRFFCKYLCPLGAFYALLNKYSFYNLKVDSSTCVSCGKCKEICKMSCSPYENKNLQECIRCKDCENICPNSSIKIKFSK